MNYDYYIGIDTGTHTGLAVWNSKERKLEQIKTVKIHIAMDIVRAFIAISKTGVADNYVFIRVEDARQRKWFGKNSNAKLQGAGSVKRDCTIWEDFLTDLGAKFEMVNPANNKTKLNAEQFKRITKYSGQTNEHNRDAAMLVYGK